MGARVERIRTEIGIDPQDGGMMAVLKLACDHLDVAWMPTMPKLVAVLEEELGFTQSPRSSPRNTNGQPSDGTPLVAEVLVAPAAEPVLTTKRVVASAKAAGKQAMPAASSSSTSSKRPRPLVFPESTFPEAPTASKQPKLAGTIQMFFMSKGEREGEKIAARQAVGEAVSINEMQSNAVETMELPSMRSPRLQPSKAVYTCSHCNKSFGRPCELSSHTLFKHPSQPRHPKVTPLKPFSGKLSASLAVAVGGGVSLVISINGKDRARIVQDAADMVHMIGTHMTPYV